MYILESTDTDISLPRKTTSERRPEFHHFNKKKKKKTVRTGSILLLILNPAPREPKCFSAPYWIEDETLYSSYEWQR